MPINCLVNRRVEETKSQRDEESKRRRDKERKRGRDKVIKRGKDKPRKPLEEYDGCAAAVMLPFWSYKSKLLTPNRQHPRAFFQKAAILFKEINRNKPFNGSTMNSLPTPPYCGFALDEFTDKMRFLPGKGLFLFIALKRMAVF